MCPFKPAEGATPQLPANPANQNDAEEAGAAPGPLPRPVVDEQTRQLLELCDLLVHMFEQYQRSFPPEPPESDENMARYLQHYEDHQKFLNGGPKPPPFE